jgi:signal peptidase I
MKFNKKIVLRIVYYIVLGFLALLILLFVGTTLPISGNYKLMTVLSGSMEPAVKLGSLVIVKPADDYKIQDIITFYKRSNRQETITHRIVDMRVIEGRPYYTTKGDANENADTREIAKAEIVGKTILDIPLLGYLVEFIKKPIGFVIMVILPACLIIFEEVKKIFKETRKHRCSKNT